MKAGNKTYSTAADVPKSVALFPLEGALLLPMTHMPLNIFEPRYLSMVDDILLGNRLIGIIQPQFDQLDQKSAPPLCQIGCLGRLTAFQENGDGCYLINLSGVCRFQVLHEHRVDKEYRIADIKVFEEDLLENPEAEKAVDRDHLLHTFKMFLEANEMEADWEGINEASTGSLVNTLSVMSPYGPAEKQALLEAPDLKTRAETLIAMTEMLLARENGDLSATTLQ